MNIKEKIEDWKEYSEMSNLPIITRRKFFNNCFDGTLTSAGIISGFLVLFLKDPTLVKSITILITGFATALAIGVSGLWGAFLSEEAERRKKILDMKKDFAIVEEIDELEDEPDIKLVKVKELKKNKKEMNRTIIEKAEFFATVVASVVDGGSPVIGASLPLIPFFFGISLTLLQFIISYIILLGLLVYLGIFLGNISAGGKLRYVIHLVIAGIVTLLISVALGTV